MILLCPKCGYKIDKDALETVSSCEFIAELLAMTTCPNDETPLIPYVEKLPWEVYDDSLNTPA